MKNVILTSNGLNDAVVKAISKADDVDSYFTCKMYASFFLADGVCTQSAHDQYIERLDELYNLEKYGATNF